MMKIRNIINKLKDLNKTSITLQDFKELNKFIDILHNSIDMNNEFLVVPAKDKASFEFCKFLKFLNKEELERLHKIDSVYDLLIEENIKVLEKFLEWRE